MSNEQEINEVVLKSVFTGVFLLLANYKPVQRSSPSWTDWMDGSRETLSTTVWHKPRTAVPFQPSSASQAIAN